MKTTLKDITKYMDRLAEEMQFGGYQLEKAINEYGTLNDDEIRKNIWWLYNKQNELQNMYEKYLKGE